MSPLSRGTGLGPHWLPAAASHPIPSSWLGPTDWHLWLSPASASRILTWSETVLGSRTSSPDPKQSFILVPDRVHYPVCYQSSYCWPSALVPIDETLSKYPPPQFLGLNMSQDVPSAFLHIWASLPQVPAARLHPPTGTSHYFVLDTSLLLLVLGNGDQRLLYPVLDRLHLHVSMWTSIAFRECNPITEKSHIHIPSLSSFFLLLFVAGHSPVWPREIVFPVFGYLCCVVGESDCHSLHMTQLSYSVYVL